MQASADEQTISRTPTHAERARTLAASVRFAALATIARDPSGFPYASRVAIATDADGRPLLLLSERAEHTANLRTRPEASVLLAEEHEPQHDPLSRGRLTIVGACAKVGVNEQADVRSTFLAAQPSAIGYVDFKDFAFHRLEPIALRYVGGFGRMSWVAVADYRLAKPDPLSSSASQILEHMNGDHASTLLAYATGLAGLRQATSAKMTAVDRYGFELEVEHPGGNVTKRLAFEVPVSSPEEVRRAMVLLRQPHRT